MENLRQIIGTALLVFSLSTVLHAWDSGGHELVAKLALDHLNPKARAEVTRLAREMDSTEKAYNAVTLANWMDDLKRYSSMPYHGSFSSWHYIDLGLTPTDPQPSLEPGDDNEIHGNIVQALKRAVVVLKGGTDPYIKNKAIACAMVMHLVADLHQPLHCATKYFYSHDKLRNDKGGNDELVLNAPAPTIGNPPFSLHFFWDTAYRASFNDSTGNVFLFPHGESLKPENFPVKPLSSEINFDQWAKETNILARDFVYANLTATDDKKSCRLSSAYVTKAHTTARAQLALAAQRLANVLTETLGAVQPDPAPNPYPAGPPAVHYP